MKVNDPKVTIAPDGTEAQPSRPATLPRSRKRRKEARPAEIIEAGLAEFAAHGFRGTRLEDVAARAGVAKGTLYRYFEDKQALFRAAMQSRALPVLDQIEPLVDAFPGTTRALMTQMLHLVYARLVESDLRILIRILVAEGPHFPELTALYHREMITRGRAILGRIMARGVARGEIRPGAAVELPLVIMGPAIMAAIWKMTFEVHEPIATERFMAAHLALLDGILLPPPG
jgi:AcrR family transcriptional regulator